MIQLQNIKKTKDYVLILEFYYFPFFLATCAARISQRSKQIWICLNWVLINDIWNEYAKNKCYRKTAFSQSSISRFLNLVDQSEISVLFTENSKSQFFVEWEKIKESREMNKNKGTYKNNIKDKRKKSKICPGKFPHYSIDGKSRKGVVSEETGRTEIDLTLFNSETQRVLCQKTLPDKEGESIAAAEIINKMGNSIPEGVFTGDAGITSPKVTSAIIESQHHYILSIKQNAGKLYEKIRNYDWDNVATSYVQISEGHGRQEMRKLKRINLSQLDTKDYTRYSGAKLAFNLETKIFIKKDEKLVVEDRFFIADAAIEELTLPQVAYYIRNHWSQESFHWVKDVILNEDNCPQKTKNGSRILGTLNTHAFTLGKKIFGSVKKFTNYFVSKPEIFIKKQGDK